MLEPNKAELGNVTHIDSGNYTTIPSATVLSHCPVTGNSQNDFFCIPKVYKPPADSTENPRITYSKVAVRVTPQTHGRSGLFSRQEPLLPPALAPMGRLAEGNVAACCEKHEYERMIVLENSYNRLIIHEKGTK